MQQLNTEKTVVAIVGRPNVGKSSLFNKIVRKRIAIVDETRGVTRDRISYEVKWNESSIFELVDTGGIQVKADNTEEEMIIQQVRKQVEIAVEMASAIIFMVDVQDGVVPEDEMIADLLRKKNKTIVVAANKADNLKLEYEATAFNKFGWRVFPISVLHNRGIEDMMEYLVKCLPEKSTYYSQAQKSFNIVLVGKPNVGKSSIFNALIQEERSIVTPVAGTTRDVIKANLSFVSSEKGEALFTISDTAGIRKKTKISHKIEYFSLVRTEDSIKESSIVALIIDALTGPTAQDKAIANLICKCHKPLVLLINKSDLLPSRSHKHLAMCEASLRKELPFVDYAPIVFISARTGYGMHKILPVLQAVLSKNESKLSTALLNRVIQKAQEKLQPPIVSGKFFRIYYGTQIGTNPIRIRLFVNNHKLLTKNYETYLIKTIRKEFDLYGVPILLDLQSKTHES